MTDPQSQVDERTRSQSSTTRPRLQLALDQCRQEARLYNEAVGSYNTHLDNHRDRRDLHDIPFRAPITAHDAFDEAIEGDRAAIEALLTTLLDQAHLDSQLRRHPRTYPVHIEAAEQLQIARGQLISTLEAALHHLDDSGDDPLQTDA